MTIVRTRGAQPTSAIAPRSLLAHVLDRHDLVAAVRLLPARALAKLIDDVGLEDAGELVALASPEQLTGVLDADLWRSDRPGADEALDAERFALWLEVLLESGAGVVADRMVSLPEELVTHALAAHVLVLDMDALGEEVAALDEDDADQLEKALDGCLCHELDQYRVVSRRHDGWDAVLALLTELYASHHGYLERLLDRLCSVSACTIEDGGGLTEALNEIEMLASDAAADRDERRAREGFVAPSDARSFLALGKKLAPEQVLAEEQRDPTTRAYFRELDRSPVPPPPREAAPLLALIDSASESWAAAKLLGGGGGGGAESAFSRAMRQLAEHHPQAHARELEVLAFLFNVVVASETGSGHRIDAVRAVERVIQTCQRGLGFVLETRKKPRGKAPRSADVIAEVGTDRLFRIGHHLGAKIKA